MPKSQETAADYSLTPSQLSSVLNMMVSVRQPTMVWGPPGVGKSEIAKGVAEALGYVYIDIRALLLDPVDLRGIPYREVVKRLAEGIEHELSITRWATPEFLPQEAIEQDGKAVRYLINLEELPNAPLMVQTALYQLVLDRRIGEYTLPETAALIACGNREQDRSGVNRMSPPLASRFMHVDLTVSKDDWQEWGARNDIEPEVLFFLHVREELLHGYDPTSKEKAFPCPRTWAFVSKMLAEFKRRAEAGDPVDPAVELAIYRGTVGEEAAVEFFGFLRVWRKLPHPQTIVNDPDNAVIPDSHDAVIALCGSLYRLADEHNLDAITTYGKRLRPEVAEYMMGQVVRNQPELQYTRAWTHAWLPYSATI